MANDATQDIINFSKTQPIWQQDALRRLAQSQTLTENDYEDLFLLLKQECSIPLPEGKEVAASPILLDHLQSTSTEDDVLELEWVGELANVNLIDPKETLHFCNGLTIVYGDNGTGKSGYTRMLKQSCASRGQQDILANVYKKDYKSAGPASAKFSYKRIQEDGTELPSVPMNWSVGQTHDNQLRRVRIYDSNIAQKLLKDNNDAEIPLPYNIDLLDDLCSACEVLQKKVAQAKQALEERRTPYLRDLETAPNVKLAFIEVLQAKDEKIVTERIKFSQEDEEELQKLKPIVSDPENRLIELNQDALLYAEIKKKIDLITLSLNKKRIQKHIADYNKLVAARTAQKKTREEFNLEEDKKILGGISSDAWELLWKSARKFSEEEAYKGHEFPVVKIDEKEALCPLCLQELKPEAQNRFTRFQKFVTDEITTTVNDLEDAFNKYIKEVSDLDFLSSEANKKSLQQLDQYSKGLSEKTDKYLKISNDLKNAVISLDLVGEWTHIGEDLPDLSADLIQLKANLDDQVVKSSASKDDEKFKIMQTKYNELVLRKALNEKSENIISFWKDQKIIDNLATAEAKLGTKPVNTQKTKLINTYANQSFEDKVKDECKKLGVRQTIGFKFSSPNSVTKHKTQLQETDHGKIDEILSEGESRAVSLACFLAEVQMISKADPVIFDDPVCSLDHRFRERVAERIAKLATERQVIVFTHDLVLWSELRAKAANHFNVDDKGKYKETFFERDKETTGKQGVEPPWKMKPIDQRLNVMEEELSHIKTLEENYDAAYENRARDLGKDIRLSWEKLVEEKLLNGVIERYRDSIQTQKLRLVDVTDEVYEDIRVGMTNTSAWAAHDEAVAKQVSPPSSSTLGDELDRIKVCLGRIDTAQKTAKGKRKDVNNPLKDIAA